MTAGIPVRHRSDHVEIVERWVLGVALIAGVLWALMPGGAPILLCS
ncbi:hypothetical protein J2X04_002386 [Lysobacter niabensis]|uniref:Uncharacterized protein n=1 Tax=Agrilutibacter niabensis TaxID=380628 RepID=A0ABU1VRM4_9GAMM|nr:hypothetical protein [Lysobacter niabensis]